MYTFQISLADLRNLAHWCSDEVPAPLRELYACGDIFQLPWPSIRFIDPREGGIDDLNDFLHQHAPPMQFPRQVRSPVCLGPRMIPFAYHNDSYYCLDCDPVLEEGGVLHQVVNVSLHTGKVKIVEKTLLVFLEKGLKKCCKDIERNRHAEGNAMLQEKANPDAAMEKMVETYQNLLAAGGISPQAVAVFEEFLGKMGGGLPAAQEAHTATAPLELTRQAEALLAQNPRQHPVQKVCARLVELYMKHAEADDPVREGGKLIERINGTSCALSDEAIHSYETGLGVTFPADLRALLLAHGLIAHGGERPNSLGLASDLIENCRQLNRIFTEDFEEEDWALWPGTRTPVMGRHLIPIGWDEPILCYDLNPGEGGVVGQLVSVDIEDSTCKVEYPGLLALLEQSIREIEH